MTMKNFRDKLQWKTDLKTLVASQKYGDSELKMQHFRKAWQVSLEFQYL